MSWITTVAGATPYDESHAMPSRTRSTFTVYVPGRTGAFRITVVVTLCPGATSAGRLDRSPSHTTVWPVASNTCAATWTGFDPAALHVTAPVFTTVTGKALTPATNVDWVPEVGA